LKKLAQLENMVEKLKITHQTKITYKKPLIG
jgi:hypothetical protein